MPQYGCSFCLHCVSLDKRDQSLSRFVILVAIQADYAHLDSQRDMPYCATHRLCMGHADFSANGMIVTDRAGCVRGSCPGAGFALGLAGHLRRVRVHVLVVFHCASVVGIYIS